MSSPVWFVNLIKKFFPYRSGAAKMTRVPGVGGLVDRMLYWGDDLMFLPGDQVVQVHEDVEGTGGTVLPSAVVEHFITQANHLWIMDRCICRDATGCRDYPIDLGCLFMGEAANGINPRLGHRVTRQEALEHVQACQEAGLVHLIGRNKLDTVWLNISPGEKLLTVCNCCPCCCLWRMLPALSDRISSKVKRMPGVSLSVTDACAGCGHCASEVCFVGAIQMVGGQAVIGETCKGCGRCAAACPEGAIELTIDETLSVEQAIERISALVDVT